MEAPPCSVHGQRWKVWCCGGGGGGPVSTLHRGCSEAGEEGEGRGESSCQQGSDGGGAESCLLRPSIICQSYWTLTSQGYLKLNLHESIVNKIRNSLPQLHQPHFKVPVDLCGQHLPYWTAQVENIFTMAEVCTGTVQR